MALTSAARRDEDRNLEPSTDQVVTYVRHLIERGALRPGDRLPAERDLATQVGVSRPTVRAGLRALAAMGVVQSRHGSGTYIPDGPPALGSEPLSFLAALHGFTRDEMYEARRILEVGAAGPRGRARHPRPDRHARGRSRQPLRVDGRPAAVPGPRHQLSSRGGARRRATRLSRRWWRWCRRCTTSAAARPSGSRSERDCATPPKCTAASIRRSGRATRTPRVWR